MLIYVRLRWNCGLFAISIATALVGCGEPRKVTPVSGIVKLDGQPVADVLVHFSPNVVASPGAHVPDAVDSSGITNAEGRFELRLADTDKPGALVGQHTVRFSDRRATSAEDGGKSTAPKSRFPGRYGDGSKKFEVPREGTQSADFELTSK